MKYSEIEIQEIRLQTFNSISTELALKSNGQIFDLLTNAKPLLTTIGGISMLLSIGNEKVFIKRIRLTDIEKIPENVMSTANLFNLPTYFQYGVGSQGFGVWRDLAAHIMSTNWVLSGKCTHFPLLYHWRVLSTPTVEPPTAKQLKEVNDRVEFWEGSSFVRKRLMENLNASSEVVLFLEYIPENLHTWLSKQVAKGKDAADSACLMVERNLNEITSFINMHGLLHFDAHFWNLLTDGHRLYLTDFGLAISNRFDLSEDEVKFFERHHNFDRCYTLWFLVDWILTEFFGKEDKFKENYQMLLQEYAVGAGKPLPPQIKRIVTQYASIAIVMDKFFKELKKSKLTLYPTNELNNI